MQYRNLGPSGLIVSRICLGCMSFGRHGAGRHEWTIDEPESRTIIRHALEAGINFFDTGNEYSEGTSEEFVGRALADFAHRDDARCRTHASNSWSTRVSSPTNFAG